MNKFCTRKNFLKVVLVFVLGFVCLSATACSDLIVSSGRSAYEIACDNGFVGTEQEWLDSLYGDNGSSGKSAYEIACDNGFVGTEREWLDSLVQIVETPSSGQDESFDINDLYNAYLQVYENATFEQFLQSFMVIGYNDIEFAAAKAMQSAVSIYSTFSRRTQHPSQSSEYGSAGAGVIYKIEGTYAYIITNYHVIYDKSSTTTDGIAHTIEVYSYGYENTDSSITAEFLGGSITKDIAVLRTRLTSFLSTPVAVSVANSNDITLGERVVAIGNPLAEGISVTSGVISVDSEEIELEALDSSSSTISIRVMRTDTTINSGNSGGGLFNTRGELVGIVNAKQIDTGVEGTGYAIPVNVAVGIAECVLDNNSQKFTLGISVETETSSVSYNLTTNKVEIFETITVKATETTLAQTHFEVDDVLLTAQINDGKILTLSRFFHLSDLFYQVREGDTISIKVLRGGQEVMLQFSAPSENFSSI